MSVLVGMEGSLAVPPPSTWAAADRRAVFSLLHQTFATFATAMRYEPANAKFFYEEIAQASLAQALKMLGCFSSESGLRHLVKPPDQELLDRLHAVFVMELPHCSYVASSLPPMLESCCLLLRLLHDLAVDAFKPRLRSKASTPASCSTPPPSLSTQVQYILNISSIYISQYIKTYLNIYLLLEFGERSKCFNPRHPRHQEEALCPSTEPEARGRSCVIIIVIIHHRRHHHHHHLHHQARGRPSVGSQWGTYRHPSAAPLNVPSKTPGAQQYQWLISMFVGCD